MANSPLLITSTKQRMRKFYMISMNTRMHTIKTYGIESPGLVASRVKLRANQSKAHEGNELNRLADPLVKRVARKANIVECDLEPRTPENAEEANVS